MEQQDEVKSPPMSPKTSAGKQRRRQMLSAFYGVAEEDGSLGGNPLDIDSPTFDPQIYFGEMMRNENLQKLLLHHGELAREIRSLDTGIQMLVYENYNKFISATDTIKNMKVNVEKMEGDMGKLLENMDGISARSDKINETLSERRERIEKLSGIQSLLKKLQFLFDLPSRLNKCIELEAYGQAVKYHHLTAPILIKHDRLPSINKIRIECTDIIARLSDILMERVRDKKTRSAQLTEYTELLMRLGTSPQSLQAEYLSCRQRRIQDHMNAAEAEKQAAVDSGAWKTDRFEDKSEDPLNVAKFFSGLHSLVISDFLDLFTSFSKLFLRRPSSDASAKAAATKLWNDCSRSILDQYLKLVRSSLKVEGISSKDALDSLSNLQVTASHVNKSMPDVRFRDMIGDIVQSTIHHWVQTGFESLGRDITAAISAMVVMTGTSKKPLQASPSQAAASTSTLAAMVSHVNDVLHKLAPFADTDSDVVIAYRPVLLDLIQVFFQKTFLHLDDALRDSMEHAEASASILHLCQLATDIEKHGIAQVLSLIAENFPSNDGDNNLDMLNATELLKRFHASSKTLLAHYVEIQGRRISLMIRKSIEAHSWLKSKEPRDVRMVMELVCKEIISVEKEAVSILQAVKEGTERRGPSSESDSSFSRRSIDPSKRFGAHVSSNIERLFAKKIQIFSAVDFTAPAIVAGVTKIALKSFIECSRLQTYSRNGFHQVQVDVHFLKDTLFDRVDDTRILETLVEEVVSSVALRCVDPVRLEQSIVNSIVRARRDKCNL